jgi:hypothetical protein
MIPSRLFGIGERVEVIQVIAIYIFGGRTLYGVAGVVE